MPSQTPVRQRILRGAAITLGTLLVLGALVVLLGPRLLQGWARDRLVVEAAKRGLQITLQEVALTRNTAVLHGLCIFEPGGNAQVPAVCVEQTRVDLTWHDLWALDAHPDTISLFEVTVNAGAAQGSLSARQQNWETFARALRPARDPNAAPRPATVRRDPRRIDLRLTRVAIDVQDQGLPLSSLEIPQFGVTILGDEISLDGELSPQGLVLPAGLQADLPEVWRLSAHRAADDEGTVTLRADTPVRVAVPGPIPGWHVELGGLSLTLPYHISFEAVAVTHASRPDPVFEFPTAALSLRTLPTRLEDLYLTRLEVQSPIVRIPLDAAGNVDLPIRPVAAAAEGTPEDAAAPEQDTPPDAGDPTVPEATPPTAPGPWDGRVWWEKIPQQILLHNAQVTVERPGAPPLTLAASTLSYALRIFHLQLDVVLEGALTSGGDPAGTVSAEVIWGWTENNLRFDLNVASLDLGAVATLLHPEAPLVDGTVSLQSRFREDARGPGLRFSGELHWTDAIARVPLLQDPLVLGDLRYNWEAARVREGDETVPAPLRNPLRFSRGEGVLNGAAFQLQPILYGFRYDRVPPTSRVDVQFSVPAQPVMTLWNAVPASLRGATADAVMAGNWGFDAAFGVTIERPAPDQPLRMRFEENSQTTMHDQGLSLVSLPEPVDVRRLNGATSFVFRGPADSINRTLQIGAARTTDVTGEAIDDDVSPDSATSWVPLSRMNYWLVAVQLYREDGRFFQNRGINWYQMRAVIEEAVAARRLGRGASTISMQLVKNVFLSHERSLERKLQELFLTYWMTRVVPKDRILEVYLNIIEWGPGINGIQEAVQYYFGKPQQALILAEATWLAAITPAPARWGLQRQSGTPPPWMMRRVADLIRGIASRGLIRASERDAGLAQSIRFVTHAEHGVVAEAPPAGETGEGLTTEPTEALVAPVEAPTGLLALPPEDRLSGLMQRTLPLRR